MNYEYKSIYYNDDHQGEVKTHKIYFPKINQIKYYENLQLEIVSKKS